MPPLYTTFGPWTLHTFTLAVGLAVILGAALILRAQPPPRRGTAANALLIALLGGVVGARLLHVLLHWGYFAEHLAEAPRLAAGGLSWHGALAGALLGWRVAFGGQRRRVHLPANSPYPAAITDAPLGGFDKSNPYPASITPHFALAPLLPLIGLAAWYGCLPAGCGYGREVETLANVAPWVAAELPDVYGQWLPRFFTPLYGLALCAAGLLLAAALRRSPRRFPAVLLLLAVGMFVIGFFRADAIPFWLGLRADQWLDALTAGAALAALRGRA